MKIHITARLSRRSHAANAAVLLTQAGHEIVSHWFTSDRKWQGDPNRAAYLAGVEFCDITQADCLVFLSEDPLGRINGKGARHVELGIAIGLGIRTIVVGPFTENIFHHFRGVEHYPGIPETIEALKDGRKGWIYNAATEPEKPKGVSALVTPTTGAASR